MTPTNHVGSNPRTIRIIPSKRNALVLREHSPSPRASSLQPTSISHRAIVLYKSQLSAKSCLQARVCSEINISTSKKDEAWEAPIDSMTEDEVV
uniref:Uncharacterized protein n=1 Tax=Oryza brachyantha TaxID=4533 RepID=J3M9U0_ORYBR